MPTYERMIVFRLGRIRTPQGPGVVLLLPFIDSFQRVDLRTRAFNVPPCKVRGFSAALDRGSGELMLGVLWMSVPWPASSQKKEEGGWEDIFALYIQPPALGVTILFSRSQWPGKWVRLGGLSGPGLPAAPAPLSWPLLTVGL